MRGRAPVLRGMRFDLSEASGALGDLGTFVPLVVSLVAVVHMDAGSVLLFAGLFNIATGLLFNQPLPVQPMKAIAAVAIAEGLSPGAVAAAGLSGGAFVLALALVGGVEALEKTIPRPVVRGIQLGIGLKLLAAGVAMAMGTPWTAADGRIVAVIAGALVLLAERRRRFPSALLLFLAGLAILAWSSPGVFRGLDVGWSGPILTVPTLAEWRAGIARGALPQVPLTLLNSVIAVCALSEDLFSGRGIGTRKMAVSVGLMNLVGCWFGGMPACHGSGGLAGQYRFGARTGGSVVMLGAAKVALGVAFGAAALALLQAYPDSILGVLLVFAGAELALPARDATTRRAFLIVAVTAGGILSVNTAVGFLLGLLVAIIAPKDPAEPG
ncbi:MAG: sulfate transporter [Gemmatimonadetes bacterium]|nr:sulfate transporter [Gemmatimonadota bacterium]